MEGRLSWAGYLGITALYLLVLLVFVSVMLGAYWLLRRTLYPGIRFVLERKGRPAEPPGPEDVAGDR